MTVRDQMVIVDSEWQQNEVQIQQRLRELSLKLFFNFIIAPLKINGILGFGFSWFRYVVVTSQKWGFLQRIW